MQVIILARHMHGNVLSPKLAKLEQVYNSCKSHSLRHAVNCRQSGSWHLFWHSTLLICAAALLVVWSCHLHVGCLQVLLHASPCHWGHGGYCITPHFVKAVLNLFMRIMHGCEQLPCSFHAGISIAACRMILLQLLTTHCSSCWRCLIKSFDERNP